MADVTEAAVDAALERGRIAAKEAPRAASVRFDFESSRIVVELAHSCLFAFPARLAQGLAGARPDQLAAVAILGEGYGLHREDLGVDVAVPGLRAGVFGTASHIARRAGRATSPSQAAAARNNGAKGGRPRTSVA